MKYDREKFYNKQKELLEKIEVLKKYYNKDIIDYLTSLVNLDECIIRDKTFMDEFGSYDFVYDLMKFNLIGRIYKRIGNEKDLIQNNFISNNLLDRPIIEYRREDNRLISVVDCDFRRRLQFDSEKDIKPKIILKSVIDRTDELLEDLENQYLLRLSQKHDLIDEIAISEDNKRKTVNLFHKVDSNQLIELKRRLELLEDEIKRIEDRLITVEKYGRVESEICNRVTDLVLDDFGLDDKDFERTVNKSLIKEYKYIDIIRRLR